MKLSKSNLTVLSVIAGLLYLPVLSSAQTSKTSIDTAKVYTLDELIISASRYEEQASSVGRNVTVITAQEIENSIHYSVADLLAEQQSVHIVGDGQTPGSLQQGFLRNANNHHSVVMIDGVRISDPSTVNNGVDLSELSLVGIERIEIVRGSHSTLYGSSAIGGVINIITQTSGDKGLSADLSTRHGVFGEDTYSTTNKVEAGYTTPAGIYLDAGISQKYTRGLDATIDTVSAPDVFNPQDRDDFQKIDLMGKAGYRTSDSHLYVSYRNEDQDSDLDQGAYNDDDNAKVNFSRKLFAYGASHNVNHRFKLSYEGAWSDLSRDFVNDSSLVDRQGTYDGTFVETNAAGTMWENSLTGTYTGDFVTSIIGLESSVQTMNSLNYVFSRSQFGVFEQSTDLDSLDLKETINAAFIHAKLNGELVSESLQPLSLTLGSRLSSHNEFGTHITYEINPKVQITSSSLLYAALTTGYNAPSLYQLNTPEQGFGAYTSRGNPNLTAEKSTSFELGWKQDIGGWLDFEISLFRTEVDDVIEYVYLWDSEKDVANLGAGDYLGDTYLNISRQEINGLELDLDVQAGPRLSLGGNLSLTNSTLTFTPGDIDESYTGGNHIQIFESGEFLTSEKELKGLTRRPQASALLRLSYVPISSLQLNVASRFVGSRDDVFYSANLGPYGAQDRSKIEGYNLTDISARYSFSNRFSITAKVENLLDSNYVEINGFKTKGRGLLLKAQYLFGAI